MFDDRNLKLDLFALALLVLIVFLSLSLGSYRVSDPPGSQVYPPGETIHNLCGRTGALLATSLLNLFGFGAYYLVASLAVLDFLLLARREVDQPLLRTLGWAMTLTAICTFAATAITQVSPGPIVGPGGYLGAAGHTLLTMHFATAGTVILTLSVFLAGLLMSTDYLAFRATAATLRWSAIGLTHASATVAMLRRAPAADEEDEEEEDWEEEEYEEADAEEDEPLEAEDEEEPEFEIRIGGKQNEPDNADEKEDVEASEPAVKRPSVKKRLAGALNIRRKKPAEHEEVLETLDANLIEDAPDYELPPIDLLLEADEVSHEAHEREVRRKARLLEETFASFGFNVKVVEIDTGPVIAQYEVELESGLRLSKITGLADDLAIALRVPSVRIVAPIPGKNSVGIEVPNENRQLVRLREVMEEVSGRSKRLKIPVYLGKDVSGGPMVVDLASMPHLLIAGRTGTGKSVCLNSIIVSMLMTRRPDEVRMLMVDPKMVELSPYKTLPHLMHPVVTDMKKAEAIMAWAVDKMEERYALLAQAGVRHITSYNQLGEEELMERLQPESEEQRAAIPTNLPFIVVVADEIADLMMTAGKEVEQHIIRLAQKSRAVGIHLILATQKPTVDVITGLIKSNLPARIAFQVSSRTDSRVVLDEMGADKLLGNGDMLFLQPGTSTLLRGQGTFLTDEEITSVVNFVGHTEPQFVNELVELKTKDEAGSEPGQLKNRDDLYESAVDIVVREGRGSVSLLQRNLGIGYGRAARLIDYMAEDGIVGPYNGSQAREVLMTLADWQAMTGEEPTPPAPKPKRPNKIRPSASEEGNRWEDAEEPEDESATVATTTAEPSVATESAELEEEEVVFEAAEEDLEPEAEEEEYDEEYEDEEAEEPADELEDDEEYEDEYEYEDEEEEDPDAEYEEEEEDYEEEYEDDEVEDQDEPPPTRRARSA